MIAGRRGQLAVTLSSGSVPACAAHRGRLLAYCYIYTNYTYYYENYNYIIIKLNPHTLNHH